jgi:tetratricopeptide (TPR) repeat protein
MEISEEGVAFSRKAGDTRAEAYTLGMMGFAALQLGELDRATRILEEALEMFREQGDEWGAAHILTHLAVVPLRRGDYAQAAWATGEHGLATRYFRDALVLTFEVVDRANAAYCLQGLAAVAGARDEPCRAARLLGAAEALLEAAGTHLYAQLDYELHERISDGTREQLGKRAWATARGRGSRTPGAVTGWLSPGSHRITRDQGLPLSTRSAAA